MRTYLSVAALCVASNVLAQVPTNPAEKVDPVKATAPRSLSEPVTIAGTLDAATRAKGVLLAQKAAAYLRSKQDEKTGGWCVPTEPGRPNLPAITGLIVNGLLLDPAVSAGDAGVGRGVQYMLSFQKPDGGIYDTMLPTYNTSITLSALARIDSDEARAAIKKGQEFLRHSQWGAAEPMGVGGAGGKEAPKPNITPDHPFYGGIGYGNKGRPDISNTTFMLQAFADTGVPSDDPAVQRALIFLQRLQMLEKGDGGKIVNDMAYAQGSKQGGFIYATAPTEKDPGKGETNAGMIEETLDDGTKVSRMRCYGSVTYAGFKSYLYAGLKKDDARVKAVVDFVRSNYTLSENPGVGTDGQYYYYLMFARALEASGMNMVEVKAPGSSGEVKARNWRADLIEQLASMQQDDGSFKSVDDRWMENNPQLITAYSLIALGHALK